MKVSINSLSMVSCVDALNPSFAANQKRSYIEAPEGMSYVNAFHALWAKALPSSGSIFTNLSDSQIDEIDTAEKVAKLFQKRRAVNKEGDEEFKMRQEGGRKINIDFALYPMLNVQEYDKANGGPGTAQKALELYSQYLPDELFDPENSCGDDVPPAIPVHDDQGIESHLQQ